MFYDRTSKNFKHTTFAPGGRLAYAGTQTQAASSQPPVTSHQRLLCLFLALTMLLIPGFGANAAVKDEDVAEYKGVIEKMSSLVDRSTGTADNKAAADYIKATLSQLDFEVVDSQQFATPVMQYGRSSLSNPNRDIEIPIHPINSNAISPQKLPPPGII